MREGRFYGHMHEHVRTSFSIEQAHIRALDRIAAREGITRSGALRVILERGIGGEGEIPDGVDFRICCEGLVDNGL